MNASKRCTNCGHAVTAHDEWGECHATDELSGEPCWAICSDSHPALPATDDDEPTATDLAAIDAEWPVIEAELGVLDAEIAALLHDGPSPLDWRRVRRARRRLLTVLAQRAADDTPAPLVDGTRDGAA